MTAPLTRSPAARNIVSGAEISEYGGVRPCELAGFSCLNSAQGLLWRGCDGIRRFGARRSPPVHTGFSAPAARLVRKANLAASIDSRMEALMDHRPYRAVDLGTLARGRAP
jgi:hypothetical protein